MFKADISINASCIKARLMRKKSGLIFSCDLNSAFLYMWHRENNAHTTSINDASSKAKKKKTLFWNPAIYARSCVVRAVEWVIFENKREWKKKNHKKNHKIKRWLPIPNTETQLIMSKWLEKNNIMPRTWTTLVTTQHVPLAM